jgi:hypothetical protein
MAPVTATSLGMAPQIVDDPKLKALMDRLNSYELHPTEPSPLLDQLVKELADSSVWRFEEQVGIHQLFVQSSAEVSRFTHLYFCFYFRLICTNGYPH